MTRVADKNLKQGLEEGEHAVAERGLHWIYMINGAFWFGSLAALGWTADMALWHYMGAYIPSYEIYNAYFHFSLQPGWIGWFFTLSGGAILMLEFLKYATTHLYVTTKRVIIKRGWINIRMDQTDLSDVRAMHVDQGWLGKFFNYGKIMLDCRFVKDVGIPFVSGPYEIIGAMQKIKSRIEDHLAGHGKQQAEVQTIININAGSAEGRTIIEHGTDRIIIESTHPAVAQQKKLPSDVILHDEILADFKKKH